MQEFSVQIESKEKCGETKIGDKTVYTIRKSTDYTGIKGKLK